MVFDNEPSNNIPLPESHIFEHVIFIEKFAFAVTLPYFVST